MAMLLETMWVLEVFIFHLPFLLLKLGGVKEGLKATMSVGINHLTNESDNLVVINSLKNVWKVPWGINNIISDAGMDLRAFHSITMSYYFREANKLWIFWLTRVTWCGLLIIVGLSFMTQFSFLSFGRMC